MKEKSDTVCVSISHKHRQTQHRAHCHQYIHRPSQQTARTKKECHQFNRPTSPQLRPPITTSIRPILLNIFFHPFAVLVLVWTICPEIYPVPFMYIFSVRRGHRHLCNRAQLPLCKFLTYTFDIMEYVVY